jgi:hypothetical protein
MSKIIDLNRINRQDVRTWYRDTYGVIGESVVKVDRVNEDGVSLVYFNPNNRPQTRQYGWGELPDEIDFTYPKIGFINVLNNSPKNHRVVEVKRRHKLADSGSSLRYRKGFIIESVELNDIVHRLANVDCIPNVEDIVYDIFFHDYPSFEEAFSLVKRGVSGLAVSSTLAITANYSANTYFLIRNNILLASWSHKKKLWVTFTDKYNHELNLFGLTFELREV